MCGIFISTNSKISSETKDFLRNRGGDSFSEGILLLVDSSYETSNFEFDFNESSKNNSSEIQHGNNQITSVLIDKSKNSSQNKFGIQPNASENLRQIQDNDQKESKADYPRKNHINYDINDILKNFLYNNSLYLKDDIFPKTVQKNERKEYLEKPPIFYNAEKHNSKPINLSTNCAHRLNGGVSVEKFNLKTSDSTVEKPKEEKYLFKTRKKSIPALYYLSPVLHMQGTNKQPIKSDVFMLYNGEVYITDESDTKYISKILARESKKNCDFSCKTDIEVFFKNQWLSVEKLLVSEFFDQIQHKNSYNTISSDKKTNLENFTKKDIDLSAYYDVIKNKEGEKLEITKEFIRKIKETAENNTLPCFCVSKNIDKTIKGEADYALSYVINSNLYFLKDELGKRSLGYTFNEHFTLSSIFFETEASVKYYYAYNVEHNLLFRKLRKSHFLMKFTRNFAKEATKFFHEEKSVETVIQRDLLNTENFVSDSSYNKSENADFKLKSSKKICDKKFKMIVCNINYSKVKFAKNIVSENDPILHCEKNSKKSPHNSTKNSNFNYLNNMIKNFPQYSHPIILEPLDDMNSSTKYAQVSEEIFSHILAQQQKNCFRFSYINETVNIEENICNSFFRNKIFIDKTSQKVSECLFFLKLNDEKNSVGNKNLKTKNHEIAINIYGISEKNILETKQSSCLAFHAVDDNSYNSFKDTENFDKTFFAKINFDDLNILEKMNSSESFVELSNNEKILMHKQCVVTDKKKDILVDESINNKEKTNSPQDSDKKSIIFDEKYIKSLYDTIYTYMVDKDALFPDTTKRDPLQFNFFMFYTSNIFVKLFQESILYKIHGNKYIVLFSGGIDSILVAACLYWITDLNCPIYLINTSFYADNKIASNSKLNKLYNQINNKEEQNNKTKILFGKDRSNGLEAYEKLKKAFKTSRFVFVENNISLSEYQDHLESIKKLVYPKTIPMDINIGACLYFSAKKAAEYGNVVFTGSGADEIFCGYNYHKKVAKLDQCIIKDIYNIYNKNLGRDDRVISHWNVEARYLFLDKIIIEFVLLLSQHTSSIFFEEDMSLNKRILRKCLERFNLEELASIRKLAMQFGSGINNLEKLMK
ncbi:hypothetical protein EDEG_02520 [Edhazardia aedis USNM 41457]|uniref:Asparagine synthetase domain-containing protein n=1 Tax=Edhazardia aedis (strain USNM 41457) TaxID=1003232 RepID=J9DP52_EDHAE|nr:hypothetical protein EDEG_02520 [Edhazardia aedis USNM 41457]|eukprot:EJW03112.1 hypothetical protein EDEG_02520 [Edhazardia aedis USNM 41457]